MRDPAAGAVVLFEGVTREVPELDYEAYAEMAEEKLRAIGEEVAAAYGCSAVALEHRTGTVPLGEPSVIVAASAPHRGEAFNARPRADRPGQGRGADLEGRGRRRRRAHPRRGHAPADLAAGDEPGERAAALAGAKRGACRPLSR